jgi:hypothetical protein
MEFGVKDWQSKEFQEIASSKEFDEYKEYKQNEEVQEFIDERNFIERINILSQTRKGSKGIEKGSIRDKILQEHIDHFNRSPKLHEDLRATRNLFEGATIQDTPNMIKRIKKDPMGVFLEHAPKNFRKLYSKEFVDSANEILLNPVSELIDKYESKDESSESKGGSKGWWGCLVCKISLWAAIVVVIGAAIYITATTPIGAIIATVSGMLVALQYITGIPIMEISAFLAKLAFETILSVVVIGLCVLMRACT